MKLPVGSFESYSVRLSSVVLSVLMTACGGGNSEGTPKQSISFSNEVIELDAAETSNTIGVLANDGTWQLDDKLFISGGELSRTQSNQSDMVTIIVGDEVFDNSNGVYSGGRVSIFLSSTGSGIYALTDKDNFTTAIASGIKVGSLNVAAGTLSNNETQWATSATSGIVSVTVNSEGRYFVSTTEPLILTRKSNVGTGIPGSPDQVSFSMRNINGVVIQ